MPNPNRAPANSFTHGDEPPLDFSLDPFGGTGSTYGGKPIFDQPGIINQIDSGRNLTDGNGVITYTFLDLGRLTGLYNNKHYGFTAGFGLTPFTDEQRDTARASIQLWDDLIPQTFQETNGLGADIQFSNSADPGQAYAYYPGSRGWKYQSDVFTADPELNWTNNWTSNLGYAQTTLVHEIGHTLGLSHPGAYNGAGATTYAAQAEYAQDSMQYTIMSYWSGGSTGARVINWTEFVNAYAQAPMLHDILTIQSKYGADPTTRATDTTYGFNSNAGNVLYDFNGNPHPYLAIYDAGGIDTIDLSGFTVSQFIDLHAGSFSSIGGAIPTLDVVNAARAELTALSGELFSPVTAASYALTTNSFLAANANSIAGDQAFLGLPAVTGIATTEYQNFAIAYGTTIENATGGSARDLIHGNEVANVLKGLGGDDVLRGFEGNDTLIGGSGADLLTGGTGNDLFVFDTQNDLGNQITDFSAGDLLDFRPLNLDLNYIGNGAFTHTAGELRYDAGVLYGDFDGNGVADFSVILTGSPTLTVDQFVGL